MLVSTCQSVTRQIIRTVVGEDKALVLESLVYVAIALEVGSWGAKLTCVGALGSQAPWDGRTAGEEPSPDSVAIPFHDIVSSLAFVEISTKRVCANFVDIAARGANGVKSTVFADCRIALAEAVDFALGVGVQNVFVHRVIIDAFDDVDLSSCQLVGDVVKIISIEHTSPLTGHGSCPRDQKAGHIPQTPGMRLTSMMKRPLL
jgi:hypothetical protein